MSTGAGLPDAPLVSWDEEWEHASPGLITRIARIERTAMFVTECKTDFLGHQIAARNSWGPALSFKMLTGENRLYIDGKVVDTNADTLALSPTPIMRGAIDEGGKIHVVEVYARSGLFRIKLRIHVDGRKIAGEDF